MVQQTGQDVETLPDISEEKAKNWIHLYISLAQTGCDLHQFLLPAEAEQHAEAHKTVMGDMKEIKTVVENYLKSVQSKKTTSASEASSVGSIQLGLQLLHIEDERKKAEAAAKLEMLKAKRELERQRQELQWKEEELMLQTEMEIQRRQAKVVNKFEKELESKAEGFISKENRDMDTEARCQPATQIRSAAVLNPEIEERQPVSNPDPQQNRPSEFTHASGGNQLTSTETPPSSSVELLSGLSHLISEQTKRISLPALEPEVFNGDVERFHLWMKSFESYIETRTSSSTERLHYLSRYELIFCPLTYNGKVAKMT